MRDCLITGGPDDRFPRPPDWRMIGGPLIARTTPRTTLLEEFFLATGGPKRNFSGENGPDGGDGLENPTSHGNWSPVQVIFQSHVESCFAPVQTHATYP